MRIAIVVLTSGGLSGGMAKHLRLVTPLLASSEQVRLFAPESLLGTIASCGSPVSTWPPKDAFRGRSVLRNELASFRPDVVFVPTARWLDGGTTPTVVMVRNMEPLEVPFAGNPWREKLVNIARRQVAKGACRRASRVIAVSRHVKNFLKSNWSISDSKIDVVYHGVDEVAEPVHPPTLYELGDRPFLFTAGSIRPARGLSDSIEALGAMDPATAPPLVIAGRVDPGAEPYRRRLGALIQRLGVHDKVIWAGHLSAGEMSWCFQNARAFITNSRAEACPNTVLEAMSNGAVSVSGDNDPMPEFFGGSAVYYRLGSGKSLAEALNAVLGQGNQNLLQMRRMAKERASAFTWRRTAEETLNVLREARR